jgi:hypothetical protein
MTVWYCRIKTGDTLGVWLRCETEPRGNDDKWVIARYHGEIVFKVGETFLCENEIIAREWMWVHRSERPCRE